MSHMEPTSRARTESGSITIDAGARLPRICFKCGVTKAVKRRPRLFHWLPAVVYLTALLGLLPFLVIAQHIRKTVTVAVPLCVACDEAWKTATRAVSVIMIGVAFAVVALLTTLFNDAMRAGIVIALSSGVAIALAAQWFVRGKRLTARSIDDDSVITLDGVCRAAVDRIARSSWGGDDQPYGADE